MNAMLLALLTVGKRLQWWSDSFDKKERREEVPGLDLIPRPQYSSCYGCNCPAALHQNVLQKRGASRARQQK
jgi:hypothetical protein